MIEATAGVRGEAALTGAAAAGAGPRRARSSAAGAAAFDALFREHRAFIHKVSAGILGNDEDAADVVQETFLRLYSRGGTFRGDCPPRTWLYRVTVNLCKDQIRRRCRSDLRFRDDSARAAEADREALRKAPDDALLLAEDRGAVRSVLSSLPAHYREVLVLRHFRQLGYEEIREVLGLSLCQVKTHLFRARKMFRTRFEALASERAILQ